jgi:hypothetical protein
VEPGGPTVPGVTTVLNIVDKPALMWSASKIAAETALYEHSRKRTIVRRHRKTLTALGKKEREMGFNGSDDEVFIHYCRGEFRRQWDAKAERGTRVHAVAEAWTKGESVDVRFEDSGYVDALEAFHRDCNPDFIHAELVVLNDIYAYGGRFDAIVELDKPYGRFLIDYKTGGHYEASLAMQQVAYMNGNIATYDDEGRLGEFKALPRLDGARGIYLHEDGTYEVVDPFKNISQDLAWEGFQACLKLYNANKAMEEAIKNG